MIIRNIYLYLYITLLILAFIMVIQVVFFNLNTKMTEGQFGVITALKLFFSINAFIMFAAELEYIIHFNMYYEIDFFDAIAKAATKVFCF